MTIQCQSAPNGRTTAMRFTATSSAANAPSWLLEFYAKVQKQVEIWSFERRVRRSRRVLEALPEHILHDIGWPNVDDRLPGIAKNTEEFKRGK
ncbi:DUF1127 domain-containing protein [Brucella tritici]|uniref:DUF1127 domain-containing protein n=1 Tax=Brucella tritici TaxID=94626 RepID=A0A6N6QHI7_9HYPH|nr:MULTISPECIES: DUF1127 domain-containing protein [Brucella]KAB2664979.1 DUF1127 domain-containing protein [Brucella tritici]KAB2676777.1 DUF1127 domain-containing protein [Brucella tritici]KAB2686259.1 DUF1127 domain-containing protein [Brucella tritici]KXO76274.1 hypothetical protein AYJ56_06335 [Brucella anthropi]